eukprot:8089291-Pyramimonas_sp.AAC.1
MHKRVEFGFGRRECWSPLRLDELHDQSPVEKQLDTAGRLSANGNFCPIRVCTSDDPELAAVWVHARH